VRAANPQRLYESRGGRSSCSLACGPRRLERLGPSAIPVLRSTGWSARRALGPGDPGQFGRRRTAAWRGGAGLSRLAGAGPSSGKSDGSADS
jgi:hypothetical protein